MSPTDEQVEAAVGDEHCLPCDFIIGPVRFLKGVKLETVRLAAERWYSTAARIQPQEGPFMYGPAALARPARVYDAALGTITAQDREYAADMADDLSDSDRPVEIIAEWCRKIRYEAVTADRLARPAEGDGAMQKAARICRDEYCRRVPNKRPWALLSPDERRLDVECLQAAVSYLSTSRPAQAEDGWKPIETAPHDHPIDVAVPFEDGGHWVTTAFWDAMGYEGAPDQPGWQPTWISRETGDFIKPSHWRPRPKPPRDRFQRRDWMKWPAVAHT